MAAVLILIVPLILMAIPIVFQIIIGKKCLKKQLIVAYGLVVILSFLLEIVFTVIGLMVSIQGQALAGIQSMSPGVIGIGFLAFLVLFVIIMIQYNSKSS